MDSVLRTTNSVEIRVTREVQEKFLLCEVSATMAGNYGIDPLCFYPKLDTNEVDTVCNQNNSALVSNYKEAVTVFL